MVQLRRSCSTDHGTFGELWTPDGMLAVTAEPPWRDNRRRLSCIPPGVYRCVWHHSPRFGDVYLVTGVPGRSHILFHSGNVAGDSTRGYHTHSLGCILSGARRGRLRVRGRMQEAVLVSRPTVRRFAERMGREPFNLRVAGGV